ncbi:MAG: tRNA pseudouridine(38-40) synthase TruA [Proteobacteria bacterium]|nr:tRNA pseudouridine(38-40) synthase TruA [Pseudomonadota bacterium]
MPRYRLTVEYDGKPFTGWQRQDNGPSVQGALEEAVFKLSRQRVTVTGAGRTDAGVHALGQVAHFDLEREFSGETLRDALNAHLRPDPISVLEAMQAAADFHARFSALARHYEYRILNRRAPPTIMRATVWHVAQDLDVDAMHEAAQVLVGSHDFTTFRSVQCQAKSPVKKLDRLDVARRGEEIAICASGRSFLHNQVRSMVGTLKRVGEGKWSVRDVERALAARDRSACGPVAPSQGLTLLRVDY